MNSVHQLYTKQKKKQKDGVHRGATGQWYTDLMVRPKVLSMLCVMYFTFTFRLAYLIKFLKDSNFRNRYLMTKTILLITTKKANMCFKTVQLGKIRIPYASVNKDLVDHFISEINLDNPIDPIVIFRNGKKDSFIAVSGVHKLIAYKKVYGNSMSIVTKLLRRE